MPDLSIGKYRGLQQCSTGFNTIAVLALDHRQNLRNALHPDNPQATTDEEMIDFKQQVTSWVSPAASAVLLDPEVGAAQCVSSGTVPGSTGLLVALEATGYTGEPTARESEILPGWSIEKARRMGANAAKLLVYYHPEGSNAKQIEGFVHQVADECSKYDLALFLEPLSYSLDPKNKKLDPEERRRVVIETARKLVTPGVDILKAEFPADISAHPDEMYWRDACRELSATSPVPWVLLSASVDIDMYIRQVTVACESGASGVAAGRAVWKEAVGLRGVERQEFLRNTCRQRMARLTDLVAALGRPWTEIYKPVPVGSDWYKKY